MGRGRRLDDTVPHVGIGTIGNEGHGKTTLTTAIAMLLNQNDKGGGTTYEDISSAPMIEEKGVKMRMSQVSYKTRTHYFEHIDCPTGEDYVKSIIAGAAEIKIAILVVSAADGLTQQTREQILLAGSISTLDIVVFINKVDMIEDRARINALKLDIENMFAEYGFSDMEIVEGSALKAIEAMEQNENIHDNNWCKKIWNLMEIIDNHTTVSGSHVEEPFYMPVEDVFPITGRGIVATGKVKRGIVQPHNTLEIIGKSSEQIKTVVAEIEMFGGDTWEARKGDKVGLILTGIDRFSIETGQVLAAVGSIQAYTRFDALIYVMTNEEGGANTSLSNGDGLTVCFDLQDFAANLSLKEGVERAMPGDKAWVEINLSRQTAVEEGFQFFVRQGRRNVGVGIVTRTIQ